METLFSLLAPVAGNLLNNVSQAAGQRLTSQINPAPKPRYKALGPAAQAIIAAHQSTAAQSVATAANSQQNQLPPWLIPGALGLLAVYFITKKK
jgi:hypothetical protein